MIRRPPRSTQSRSSAASDVYKRQGLHRPTGEPRGGYVAFLGRISPEKRPDRAIAIARSLGIPLKIAAKVDRVDEAYFREKIAPLIDGVDVQRGRRLRGCQVRPSMLYWSV